MRTNIDDRLIAEALAASGLPTKKAVVERALRSYLQRLRRREAVSQLGGPGWDGDLDAMRSGRSADWEK